jgi:endonuclease/exonuclease/phosphatase (EEP) superfamily protein YafD
MARGRRRAGAIAAGVPWLVWAAVRLTGSERGFPLVPALTFTPHAAAGALLPVGLALRARSRAGLLLSAGAGTALAAAVLARAGGAPAPAPPGQARLRVATVSLRLGLVAAAPVLDLVRRHDVDVLSVQELTPEAERRLRAAGIDELLPHAHVIPARPGSVPAASGAVWSRWPMRPQGAVPGTFEQPTVLLRGPAGGPDVELTAVHTVPPSVSAAFVRGWHADLAALPSPEPDVLRVLAGDFNASLDHAALRRVLRRGYTDAARAVGRALTWTWAPLGVRFPRLTIDHVLVDPRIAVAAVDVVPVVGSDHRAVVAELVLPRP